MANRPEVAAQIDVGLAERTKCSFTTGARRKRAKGMHRGHRTTPKLKRLGGLAAYLCPGTRG